MSTTTSNDAIGSASRRLRRNGEEQLLQHLLELDGVARQVLQRLLELLGGGAAGERSAGAGADLVGHPFVQALELLIGVLQALRVHVTGSPWEDGRGGRGG